MVFLSLRLLPSEILVFALKYNSFTIFTHITLIALIYSTHYHDYDVIIAHT